MFRLWNILEYWFPYRDLMERDRVAILRDATPAAWSADRVEDYQRVLLRLIARAQDTHANLWSSLSARPPVGAFTVPVALRMIEGKPVVSAFSNDTLGLLSGLRIGDAILTVDGVRIDSLFRLWTPLYAASNEPTRQRDMARSLLRGADTVVTLLVDRDGTLECADGEAAVGISDDGGKFTPLIVNGRRLSVRVQRWPVSFDVR